jgi:hypothetical protein
MVKFITVLLAAGLALLGPTGAATPGSEFRTAFCPECWRFRSGTGTMDVQGQCKVCGKLPVEINAASIPWYWCTVHRFWHRKPCEESKHERCLSLRESLAAVIEPGQEYSLRLRYCPECRTFPHPRGIAASACPTCRKPTVTADAVQRTWFWCRHDLQWKEEPCPEFGHEFCCSPRTGWLLARAHPLETGTPTDR